MNIHSLEQLIEAENTSTHNLNAREATFFEDFISKSKALCFPAIHISNKLLTNRKVQDLLDDNSFFDSSDLSPTKALQLKNYLLVVTMCIDKSFLEKTSSDNFFK
ncbi:hypothetical protein [Pleionea sp. CnH1-48]|uniref:hypothetical protein n=1 Tax=Pleionea sp. CnH1-48 TaxID=2954494 RepID=UPI002097F1E2|nr:hypothetical protein [Pleionea sp. CnH1-48]MCO7226196.1 hypothetical protein [Pleionea sp. CnH1-48]